LQKIAGSDLPRFITPKLSYLIGWLCGDGSFSSNRYYIKISEKSRDQLVKVLKPLIKDLFGVDVPIFKKSAKGFAIQFGSKPVFKFFKRVLKLKVGKTPKIIELIDKTNKVCFIRGIFDSEGYVDDSYLNSKIVISQASKKFLRKVISLCKQIGIEFKGPYFHKTKLGTWYTIQIRKKREILKFFRYICSSHINKLNKLENLVRKIEEKWGS